MLQLKISVLILAIAISICWLMTFILNRWLFSRLDRMSETATMVAGGDYQREIKHQPTARLVSSSFSSISFGGCFLA